MGGQSNRHAFSRLWRNLLPGIKRKVPDVRLLMVGANPPESITRLHDGRDVVVTGYVDDVRPHLAQAKVGIVPLDVAGGFRGRTIEMMAMEVPVVGTHRALDCVELTSGVHGFVADGDGELAAAAARLLTDEPLRIAMGTAARALTVSRNSLDRTIAPLSDRYLAL